MHAVVGEGDRLASLLGRQRLFAPPSLLPIIPNPLCTVVVRGRASCTPCHMVSDAGIAWKHRRQPVHAVLYLHEPPLLGWLLAGPPCFLHRRALGRAGVRYRCECTCAYAARWLASQRARHCCSQTPGLFTVQPQRVVVVGMTAVDGRPFFGG